MPTYRTVFISHAHADNARCANIAALLRARGVDVWIDLANAQVAHNLDEEINDQLERRTAFVLMVTATSNASHWVRLERGGYISLLATPATRSVNGVERMIVPVRLSDEVPVTLRGLLWLDAMGKSDEQVADAIATAVALTPGGPTRVAGPVVAPGIPTDRRDSPVPPPARDEAPIPSGLYRLGFRGWHVRATAVEYIEPPTCDVAAGAFDMGSAASDTEAVDEEKPQYRITVGPFAIGKFPVTVAEYACYLRANPGVAVPPGDDNDFYGWKQQQTRPDHPVVKVSWFNARDYVAWLAQATGQPWRLPTEAEWEKAARWDAAQEVSRIYPWGDAWDETRANTSDGGLQLTTPVGAYPSGASPYGAQDMAGNVWEWCSSLYNTYPYNPAASEILDNRTDVRVSRGGSWYLTSEFARAAYRYWVTPSIWIGDWGVRVVRGVGAGAL